MQRERRRDVLVKMRLGNLDFTLMPFPAIGLNYGLNYKSFHFEEENI
jgi:hypothetical protein